MKRKVELEELSDAQVGWLSLVDAGAARTSFKIQKAEDAETPRGSTMSGLNFKNIFKDEAFQPRLLAVAVAEGVTDEQAKAVIEKAGLDAQDRKQVEGAGIYETAEGALDSATGQLITLKLSEKVGVVCDVAKSFSPFGGSTDFTDNLKSMGFIPSLELGMDALRTTTFESLHKAENRSDAAKMVGAAADDFASHVRDMVAGLPEDVFKLEEIVKLEFAQFDGTQTDKPAERDGVDGGSATGADLTAGEEGTTGLSGSQDADVTKATGKPNPFAKKTARKAAFDALGFTPEQVTAIEMVVEKQGGVASSGVATGESAPPATGSPGSPVVDQATDQEFGGLVEPGSSATIDSATSSHPEGTSLQASGVTKDELAEALKAALAPFAALTSKVEELETKIEAGVAKAEQAGKNAARGAILGQPVDDDGDDDRAEVRYSEPPMIDTGMSALGESW